MIILVSILSLCLRKKMNSGHDSLLISI